jgi:hypothetical protein
MSVRRYGLRDDQWDRMKDMLPGRAGMVGRPAGDNRLFVEAVLYRYRSVMGSLDKGIIQMQQLNVDAAWKNYVSERTAYFAQQAQQAPQ